MIKTSLTIFVICLVTATALAGKEVPVIQIVNPEILEYSQKFQGYETSTTSGDLQLKNRTLEFSVLNFRVSPESPLLAHIDCHNNHCLPFGFVINAGQVSVKLQLVPIPFSTDQSSVTVPVGHLSENDEIRFDIPAEVIKVKRALNICFMGCKDRRPDIVTIRLF